MFAALAVSRWIEDTTEWSIKKFVPTTRRYHTIEIQAGAHTITAADPLPDDLREILRTIHGRDGAHSAQVRSSPGLTLARPARWG
ncbi:hypothetical protein [Kribbella sp. NBC_01510]|uniref:hypothetical protein n=1 Tax=Kribbella sp. NBC_01510 TaxID=2903581 RepID=UPI00386647EE